MSRVQEVIMISRYEIEQAFNRAVGELDLDRVLDSDLLANLQSALWEQAVLRRTDAKGRRYNDQKQANAEMELLVWRADEDDRERAAIRAAVAEAEARLDEEIARLRLPPPLLLSGDDRDQGLDVELPDWEDSDA